MVYSRLNRRYTRRAGQLPCDRAAVGHSTRSNSLHSAPPRWSPSGAGLFEGTRLARGRTHAACLCQAKLRLWTQAKALTSSRTAAGHSHFGVLVDDAAAAQTPPHDQNSRCAWGGDGTAPTAGSCCRAATQMTVSPDCTDSASSGRMTRTMSSAELPAAAAPAPPRYARHCSRTGLRP